MHYSVEKKVNSDIKCGSKIVEEILQNIEGLIDHDAFFNTKLILNELMINSVIHGNCGDLNKMIYIKVYINRSRIIIEVSDEGSGICYDIKDYGQFDYLECGRGLMLVEGLVDKLNVDGNTVTCVQYLK
ncbi:MAG: ATP-binding protein [Tissierellia bacterium]|jgi:serine/threonine-protein kinase RsbW|nr:ATP-binding protein [Tissierellia bacterium]MDD3226551.1 ATP-binding protein [Tissierellia bacterium]MDD3751577.1 ATP-binding protein [Tissierellia bacterium]MDD4045633.1 ATP-binding protein [Tissierellia bacterium]MDD4678289.1 ATP-binding protein [Tissierellia bacterium]